MTNDLELSAACQQMTEPEELLLLISGSDLQHRLRLAQSPETPDSHLAALSRDESSEVRSAVGGNMATPHHILEQLSKDESISVRFDLAEHPWLPPRILMGLTRDENPYVRQRAIRTIEGLAFEQALRIAGFVHESGQTDRLGELLAESGVFTSRQIDEFLRQAQEMQVPLAQVLVQSKRLPRSFIVMVLNVQTMIRRGEISHREGVIQLKMVAGNL